MLANERQDGQLLGYEYNPYFGCDPELFITTKDGEVVGAEKVLPEGKLITGDDYNYMMTTPAQNAIVLDGVQIELNPSPNPCRANLGNTIKLSMQKLRDHLQKQGSMKVSFQAVVTVSKTELDSLSDKAKVFGCAPSLNMYDTGAKIQADPTTYLKRSAGGHIHLGIQQNGMMNYREDLVKVMDVIVGNTCVLIDRDPEAAERRLNYGRAGEYRLPPHGIEYRTLSNFWMRSYQLMSLVMGLSRMACNIVYAGHRKEGYIAKAEVAEKKGDNYTARVYRSQADEAKEWDAFGTLMNQIDPMMVRDAINGNDLQLALKNWAVVKQFINEHSSNVTQMGIGAPTIPNFEYFCKKVWESGIEYWFPDDPMTHWCSMPEGHETGWENFLTGRVVRQMKADGVGGGCDFGAIS